MTSPNQPPQQPRSKGKPRVIVTRKLMPAVEARLSLLFDAELNHDDEPLGREGLIAAMQAADVLVPTVTDRIDAEMIVEAGERLQLIASFGAGTDHIDIAAARTRKIIVTNTPGVLTDDTADLTMALIIAVPRRLAEGVRMLQNGAWHGWAPTGLIGHRLGGRVLAIVGMGRIGQAVAHRARAFGLDVVYHNRTRLPAALENMLGARYEPDLDMLIARADILSLHCPASAATRHLLNAERIAMLKPGAYVINTARGDLIDEEALFAALSEGRIAGAGFDVFVNEPKIDPRFLSLPNVLALPHMGSATEEGREAAGERVVANIRYWADGHRPPDQVIQDWV
jgi:glyoxylate reductase